MNKLIIEITGISRAGKSYLSEKLKYENSIIVSTDLLFLEWIGRFCDISFNYHNLTEAKKIEYHEFARNHIAEAVGKYSVIILEGYMLLYLNLPYEMKTVVCNKQRYFLGQKYKQQTYKNAKALFIDKEITEQEFKEFELQGDYLTTSEQVQETILKEIKQELKEKTIYQSFDDLGQSVRSSNSKKKFESLKNIGFENKYVLDIGCNFGYFSFKSVQNGAKQVYGIDVDSNAIHMANSYKNKIYQYKNVEFKLMDIFDWNKRIDVVLCLSVFHYFRERQQGFIKEMYKLINKGGTLVIETGINQTSQEIIKYARHEKEDPCYYPNEKKMIDMLKQFSNVEIKESVKQPGDNIPRKVFIATK